MKGKSKAKIIGTGSYLPERILSNADLEKIVDTNDEWIVSRTGMRERRIARSDEFTSDMGAKAAHEALNKAQVEADELDLIIVATITPDYLCPSTACIIQRLLGAKHAGAMDIQATCSGYLYGLAVAYSFVHSGLYSNVLVVASEKLSSFTDYQDRATCVLFGDGAAACVVSSKPQKGLAIKGLNLGADGEQTDLLCIPSGGARSPASNETVSLRQHYIRMAGNEVFKHAVRRMEAACKACLENAGISEDEISWLVPHQANIRIIEALAKRFEKVSSERIFKTIHKYGNTSASSLGIALDELIRQHPLRSEEKVLLTAFGGGLTWAAAVLSMEGE